MDIHFIHEPGIARAIGAAHLVAGLVKSGGVVMALDLDGRPKSFSRVVENASQFSWGLLELPGDGPDVLRG